MDSRVGDRPVACNAPFLAGGGEMGARIRAFDWARTPLGAPDRWPQALRTVLRILLTTQHPVFIFWGPGHHCFYNDAYRRSLGDEKHPTILGQPGRAAFPEIWDIIGPQIEHVMRGDGATWYENHLVPILRNGRIEDVYWTYSYGPIDDETAAGGVGGVLVLCTETTSQVATTQALRDKEARLQLALDVASLGVWETRVSDGATHADKRIRALFDIADEHSTLETWMSRIHPEDIERVRARRERLRAGETKDLEYRVRTATGEHWVHTRARLMPDPQRGDYILGVAEDVTVARGLRDTLETSRRLAVEQYERMTQMFEQAPGFICILRGPEHRFEFVNDAYVRAFGPRPLLGLTVREAFPELSGQGYYELLDRVYRDGERYVASGATLRLEGPGLAPRDFVLDFIYEPMRDENGAVNGIFVEGQDVTERTRADAALRESEARFRSMADSSPLIIWLTDAQHRLEFANEAFTRFFGVTLDDLAESGWRRLVHPESRGFIEGLVAAHRERQPFDGRARVRHADGSWRWLRSYAAPRFGRDGEFLGMVGNSPEITDVVAAEAAVREAARQKDEFLAMLAHELRNPMAPIRNAAEILARALPSDSPLLPVSGLLRRQAAQLSRLVDDLLDVSRITQGRIDLKRRRIDLNAVIAQALETVEPLMREKSHTLRSQTPGDSLWVDADPERMVQALSNVLANAAKYTDRGGQVRVLAHAAGDEAVVTVADDGIGIAEEMLPRVFDLFVQSERALDRAQGGLGIGLSVVKRLVEMHGGRVSVTSGGPGTGSTFEIRLPRVAVAAPEAASQGASGSPTRRVLVVDDNRDAAESLALLLQLDGHVVEATFDPRRALELAPAFQPEVVLLDIGMPGMDGFEVAHRLRAAPELDGIVLVALTGYGRAEDRDMTAAAGFDAHLVKPVDLGALAQVLAASRASPPRGAGRSQA